MKRIIYFLFLIVVFAYSIEANANLIVDTGEPPPGDAIGSTLADYQWIAAEFTTSQDYFINEILGWIDGEIVGGPSGGSATAAIYADDYVGNDSQGSPATSLLPGTELFSAPFNASAPYGWYGPSGLNWFLPAGTYWVSYEVRTGQTLLGAMRYGAPNPLTNQAFTIFGGWSIISTPKSFGMRIDATPAPIPEPTTMLLLGTGLVGVAGAARRKKKNQA